MLRRIAFAAAVVALVAGFASHSGAHAAARSATAGVVLIDTNLALENASAAGTGIVLTGSGIVVTNNHVIRGATTIKVVVPATHKSYSATVLGYDITDDVALLQLQDASNLATAQTASSALRLGASVRAVGNANGGGALVQTVGRVTGLARTIQIQDDSGAVTQLKNLIQTSAKLVPGDSGGPLLNASGRVVGIDAAGSLRNEFTSTSGPGYAIPIDRALTIVRQIELQRASASVHIGATAFIGLSVQQSSSGVVIGSVVPSSPADQAGLQEGDVITTLDGSAVSTFTVLRTLLFAKHPGDSVTLGYVDQLGNQSSATIVLTGGPPQ